jgi:preprotein translocase subunit SecE
VARNRKRAKDRRPRRPEGAAIGRGPFAELGYGAGDELALGPEAPEVSAPDVPPAGEPPAAEHDLLAPPDPLGHASPDAELAEAQLALGRDALDRAGDNGAGAPSEVEDELAPEASAAEPAARAARAGASVPTPARIVPSEPLPVRLVAFLQGSWKELQRVQWPDRRQVMQATGVVIGFVIVAGILLAVSDLLSKRIVDFILYGHFS